MKKYCFYVLSLFMATAMSVSLSSCGDDDDEVGGGGTLSPEATTVTDANGVPYRVTSFGGEYFYSYDGEGKLSGLNVGSTNYKAEITYSPFIISESFWDYDYEDNIKTTFSLNGKGFISGYSSKFTFTEKGEDGYSETGTETVACQYNDAGQLTKYTSKGNYSGKEDGEKYSGSWNGTTTLTWQDGNLTKMACTATEVEDGEKDSESWSYTFEYGTQANGAGQWLRIMQEAAEVGIEEMLDMLGPTGLFGHGPKQLPIAYTETDEEGNSHNGQLAYTMNDNGTIHSDNGAVYTYDAASAEEVKAQMKQMMPTMRKAHRSMNHRIHARRMAKK